jgi:hypothetical protein
VKQPSPNRLTNRPHHRRIQCEDRLTPYLDTRASVDRAEVTAVTSRPLLLSDLTGKQRRSPRFDCRANHPGEADNKSRSTTKFGLGRNRKLRLARPQAPASGGGLCLARPQAPASEGSLRLATLVTLLRAPWCRIIQGLSHLLCSIPRQPIWAEARNDNFTRRSRDPPGPKRRQLARQVGACCVLTNAFPLSSRWGVFSNLFSPGRCSASGVSSSCPSTAATTWYSSPRGATTTTVFDSPGGGELDDSISPRQNRSAPVVPATLLTRGGGDGATMATQEVAPCRLSHQSESTTPTLPRGTCRALSSHLRQRRVSLPRNVSAPSGLMTPAPSQRICWALPSYLR